MAKYDLESQVAAGERRPGSVRDVAIDVNPNSGEGLLHLRTATVDDGDLAYLATNAAQKDGACRMRQ